MLGPCGMIAIERLGLPQNYSHSPRPARGAESGLDGGCNSVHRSSAHDPKKPDRWSIFRVSSLVVNGRRAAGARQPLEPALHGKKFHVKPQNPTRPMFLARSNRFSNNRCGHRQTIVFARRPNFEGCHLVRRRKNRSRLRVPLYRRGFDRPETRSAGQGHRAKTTRAPEDRCARYYHVVCLLVRLVRPVRLPRPV